MTTKSLMASIAAAALVVSPTVAAAQSATSAPAQIAPAEETVEGSELRRGGFIIPLVAIIAIILGILAATGNLENDRDTPRSPG